MAWNLVNYHTTKTDGTPGPDIPIYDVPVSSIDIDALIPEPGYAGPAIFNYGIRDVTMVGVGLNRWQDIFDETARGFNVNAHLFNQREKRGTWGFARNDGTVEGSYNNRYQGATGDRWIVEDSFRGTPAEAYQWLQYKPAVIVPFLPNGAISTSGALNPVPNGPGFNPVGFPVDIEDRQIYSRPQALINTVDSRQYVLSFAFVWGSIRLSDGTTAMGMASTEVYFAPHQFLAGDRDGYSKSIVKSLGDGDGGGEDEGEGVMARYQPRVSTSTVGAYILNKGDLLTLVRDFWDTDLIDSIRTAFIGDGSNTILGLYWFYGIRNELTVGDGKAHPVLGNVVYPSVQLDVSITDFVKMDMGAVNVQPYYGNAMDYVNATYHCYIPFVGQIELDPNDILGKDVSLIYIVNLTDGSASATLTTSGSEVGEGVIFTATCSWGYDIPLRADSQMNAIARIYHELAPITGPLGGAEGGSFSAGSLAPNSNIMVDFQPKIIIHRQDDISGSDFAQVAGVPGSEPVTVGSVSGYLQVSHVLNAGSLPMRQTGQIEALLREGVYVN